MTARLFLVVILAGIGGSLGFRDGQTALGVAAGLLLGCCAVLLERLLRRIPFGQMIGGIIGLSLGMAAARLILYPLDSLLSHDTSRYAAFGLSALLGYSGLIAGFHRGGDLSVSSLREMFRGRRQEQHQKLLDSSVIIDGRIAGIIEAGFLEGKLIVPGFILEELQHIADSPDPMRRARGRRGLDILQKIRKMPGAEVVISLEDPAGVREPDAKLLALSRSLGAKIVTNDFNLHKVAQLQGITVCNINELANAMKPLVLPGETLQLFVAKEGKEPHQGVAYLDDGTMVVIENGRQFIGRGVAAEVTSMLQTTAGRMVFARPKDDARGPGQ